MPPLVDKQHLLLGLVRQQGIIVLLAIMPLPPIMVHLPGVIVILQVVSLLQSLDKITQLVAIMPRLLETE